MNIAFSPLSIIEPVSSSDSDELWLADCTAFDRGIMHNEQIDESFDLFKIGFSFTDNDSNYEGSNNLYILTKFHSCIILHWDYLFIMTPPTDNPYPTTSQNAREGLCWSAPLNVSCTSSSCSFCSCSTWRITTALWRLRLGGWQL